MIITVCLFFCYMPASVAISMARKIICTCKDCKKLAKLTVKVALKRCNAVVTILHQNLLYFLSAVPMLKCWKQFSNFCFQATTLMNYSEHLYDQHLQTFD